MRKLIAAMKATVDGKIERADGPADWVDAWSDDYGLTPQIDACVLGAGMYSGYEKYWTGIRNEPKKPAWITGAPPTAAEVEWAGFAARTPHYVLSKRLTSVVWPNTKIIRGAEDVATLKKRPGKDIYLMGGAQTTASLIDAGVVDELRLIVYPLIAGKGKPLFAGTEQGRALELQNVQQLANGLVSLIYGIRQ
jgi:dihydrofolate reductase